MNKNSNVLAILIILGGLLLIGWIGTSLEKKECAQYGCSREAKEGSNYCWIHDNNYRHSGSSGYKKSTGSYSSGNNATSTGSATEKYNQKVATSTSNTYSTNKKTNAYQSYNDGYEDVYNDGDYDIDRYYKDSDYADGVDDAEGEWEDGEWDEE